MKLNSNISMMCQYRLKKEDGWWAIKLRKELLKRIEEYLETPQGKRTGFTNAAQFIDSAVRELLKDLIQKRFEHINTFEDKVRVLDNMINKNGDIVTIFFKDKSGWCDHCNSTTCIHIKYAWSLDDVSKTLKRHGLKPPG